MLRKCNDLFFLQNSENNGQSKIKVTPRMFFFFKRFLISLLYKNNYNLNKVLNENVFLLFGLNCGMMQIHILKMSNFGFQKNG